MRQININVSGKVSSIATLVVDGGGTYEAKPFNERFAFILPDSELQGHGATIRCGNKEQRVLVPPTGMYEANLPPVRPPEATEDILLSYRESVSRILVRSDHRGFVTEDGQPFIYAMHSDFQLFEKFIRGVNLDGLLDERIAAGSRGPRVFGMCGFLFKLDPRGNSTFYTSLRAFADYLLGKGLYWEYTALADAQSMTASEQQDHWVHSIEALNGSPNTFIELVNEFGKNGVDPSKFSHTPNGCLQAHGSGLGDEPPAGPAWDYQTFHPRRDWKWPFTVAATVNEVYQYPGLGSAPVVIDEPIGADEVSQPGRRSTDAAAFERMGVDCALWAGGGCFHSTAGLTSDSWGPIQTACAQAFFRGLTR